MIIEKQRNGSYLITDFVGNNRIHCVYYFYTKADAIQKFRQYRKQKKDLLK